jgi:hypothetical protein
MTLIEDPFSTNYQQIMESLVNLSTTIHCKKENVSMMLEQELVEESKTG